MSKDAERADRIAESEKKEQFDEAKFIRQDAERISHQLRGEQKRHEGDRLFFAQTDISAMARDSADCIDGLTALIDRPTADVVEVVRCKDCVKRRTPNCQMYWESDDHEEQYSWESDDDFCSAGERATAQEGAEQ